MKYQEKLFSLLGILMMQGISADSYAWTGELEGHINDKVIVGAGSYGSIDGLSLLGTIYLSNEERAILQLQASSITEGETIAFSSEAQGDQRQQLNYQVFHHTGRQIFSAVASGGEIKVHAITEREINLLVNVSFIDQGVQKSVVSQNLRLINTQFEEEVLNQDEVATDIMVTANNEGCDANDETEYYDDEEVSCDSSSDSDNDDYDEDFDSGNDDGCTDDEWAAEASNKNLIHTRDQRKLNRSRLRSWRLLNRIFPILCSLLFLAIWRRLIRMR